MKDALSFIGNRTRTWKGQLVFHLIFLFPILGAVLSRLGKHRHLLNDYDALACGAWSLARGLSPYARHPVCPGLDPAAYVYAPQVGLAFRPFIEAFGLEGSRLVWLIPLVPMMGVLIWYALFKAMPRAPYALRLMSLAAIAGSMVTCGNAGFVLNGLIVLCALNLKRSQYPFIIAVLLAAMIKPAMLTWLFVLMVDDRRWLSRIAATAVAAVAGLAIVGWMMTTAGPLTPQWHALLGTILHEQPGVAFFSYSNLIGLDPGSPLTLVLLALFMGVLALSGLVLAEGAGLSRDERIVLGIGMAQLLNPRLMDYDMLTLAPFVALLVMLAKDHGSRAYSWMSWVFAGTLIGCVATNIVELPLLHRAPVTVFVYCGMTVALALLTLRRHRATIQAFVSKAVSLSPSSRAAS
ncbi:hypothetical protein [Asticcacaulis solisilvae]|uniref:hypothetical protein n=1 Tax=Asticcacaulis solisilvae TaxID=1217274 RepID=UPI003FD78588